MRKLIIGAVVALALPATAAAAPKEPTPEDLARAACKTEKHAMGTQLFKKTYGAKSTSKAMKACIAKAEVAAEEESENAAQACKAERDANEEAFADKYGTNKNGKNAFGKCVSGKASEKKAAMDAADAQEVTETKNAAKWCAAERKRGDEAFAKEYGTNKNGKNAFGRCVSQRVSQV
jgi:hypothetical protein